MSLCKGISDDTEDATITIDDATILEIKAMIGLPFQLRLTSFVEQRRQRNSQKVCWTFRVFFRLFSRFSSLWSHRRSSLVALHHAKHAIIDMRRCGLKNQRFDGKRATKSTSLGTHRNSDARILLCSFPKLSWENGFPLSYNFLMLNKEAIN